MKDTQEEKQKKEILFSAGVVLTDICYLLLLLLLLSPDIELRIALKYRNFQYARHVLFAIRLTVGSE